MAENTAIEWCDSTFNPWIGCTKISPACDHCYAEGWAKRSGLVKWNGTRKRTSGSTWAEPRKWQKQAAAFHAEHGRRRRVFCASLADVFDNQVPTDWRFDLWALIRETPDLDWLLLTKRPMNIAGMLPAFWDEVKGHVWLGTTVEDQARADQNLPHLIKHDAAVRFVSCEPLLGPVYLALHMPLGGDMSYGINWVIAGGESGHEARPSHPDWFRLLRDQCDNCAVPFLFKQWGNWLPGFMTSSEHAMMIEDSAGPGKGMTLGRPPHSASYVHHWHDHSDYVRVSANIGKAKAGRLLDGIEHNGFPEVRHG